MPPPPPLAIPDPPSQYVDTQGRVLLDIRCHKCGYDLRHQPLDASCPECEAPVRTSVRGDLIMFSDPRWLSRVQAGIGLLLLALVVRAIASLGFFAYRFLGFRAMSAPNMLVVVMYGTFLALSLVACGVAYWWLTTREPVAQDDPMRQVARVGLIAGVVAAITVSIMGLGLPEELTPFTMLDVLGAAASIVGWIGLMRYAWGLARRIPDERLAGATLIIVGLLVAAQLATLVGRLLFTLNAADFDRSPFTSVGLPRLVLWTLALIPIQQLLGVAGVVLLIMFGRRLTTRIPLEPKS